MTPAGAPLALTPTRASRRSGAGRARVTREGTHAAHAGGALAHVSATSQSSSISSTHGGGGSSSRRSYQRLLSQARLQSRCKCLPAAGGAAGTTTTTAISMSQRSRIAMHQPTSLVARRAAQTAVGLVTLDLASLFLLFNYRSQRVTRPLLCAHASLLLMVTMGNLRPSLGPNRPYQAKIPAVCIL